MKISQAFPDRSAGRVFLPEKTAAAAPGCRGSAVSEFMICLFPYMIILLGALFFWHLTLGKQELFDYAQTAAALDPSAAKFWNIDGDKGGAMKEPVRYDAAADAQYNAKVGVNPRTDEPVLPYSQDGTDFKSGVSRSVYHVTANADGTISVGLSKQGKRLAEQGVIINTVTGDNLPPSTNLDFDVDAEISRMVSQALGDWISYRGVDGGRYRYTLRFGAGSTFGMEKGAVTDNWRSATGVTVGGSRSFGAYNTRIEDSSLRGDFFNPQIGELDTAMNTQAANLSGSAQDISPEIYRKYPAAAGE